MDGWSERNFSVKVHRRTDIIWCGLRSNKFICCQRHENFYISDETRNFHFRLRFTNQLAPKHPVKDDEAHPVDSKFFNGASDGHFSLLS